MVTPEKTARPWTYNNRHQTWVRTSTEGKILAMVSMATKSSDEAEDARKRIDENLREQGWHLL